MSQDAEFDWACARAILAPYEAAHQLANDVQRDATETARQMEVARRKAAEANAEHWKLRALYAEARLAKLSEKS